MLKLQLSRQILLCLNILQKKYARIELGCPSKELIENISKKLMPYAMVITSNDSDDAWDLIQHTIEKLIINREIVENSDYPMAYAKKILKISLETI